MKIQAAIQRCLDEWPQWKLDDQRPQVLKVLGAGKSNHSLLIACAGKRYVLRYHKPNARFTAQRDTETRIQQAVAQIQQAPAIRYTDADGHYRISDYVEGNTLAKSRTFTEASVQALCHSVQRFQALDTTNIELPTFNYTHLIENYWQALNKTIQASDTQRQRYTRALQLCDRYQTLFSASQCLVHHDLNPNNIVQRSDDYKLPYAFIDWEFAGLGIASFDFGALTVELALPTDWVCKASSIDTDQLRMAANVYQELCYFYNCAIE